MARTLIHLTERSYNGLKCLAVEPHRHMDDRLKTISFCNAITLAVALMAAAAFAPVLAQDTAGQSAETPGKIILCAVLTGSSWGWWSCLSGRSGGGGPNRPNPL